ncbi:MAG: WecB/TagA/CpsF family glycosyltransferase [Pseudomonadales bacterium]
MHTSIEYYNDSNQYQILDAVLAIATLTVFAPLFIIGLLHTYVTHRCFFLHDECIGRQEIPFYLYRFEGKGYYVKLAMLINILKGEISFVGPRLVRSEELQNALELDWRNLHFKSKPGIFSLYGLHKKTGIHCVSEFESDRDYFRGEGFTNYCLVFLKSLFCLAFYRSEKTAAKPKFVIFGVNIDNLSLKEAVNKFFIETTSEKSITLNFVNAHSLNLAFKHADFRNIINKSDFVLADGSGIAIACNRIGVFRKGNINGTDLFPLLCERLNKEHKSLFLLGGQAGIALGVKNYVNAHYPNIRVAGTLDGYFGNHNTASAINQINESCADVLLVGLGQPRQERWINSHKNQLKVKVIAGVGGLFDFYSGNIPRAPMWLREIGCEWVWRLMQEPRRMFKRYVVGNPMFLFRLLTNH